MKLLLNAKYKWELAKGRTGSTHPQIKITSKRNLGLIQSPHANTVLGNKINEQAKNKWWRTLTTPAPADHAYLSGKSPRRRVTEKFNLNCTPCEVRLRLVAAVRLVWTQHLTPTRFLSFFFLLPVINVPICRAFHCGHFINRLGTAHKQRKRQTVTLNYVRVQKSVISEAASLAYQRKPP